ncbi:MAG: DUF86 domain-containing protein [bacterium]
MQSDRANLAYLWDMLDAAKAIQEFVGGRTFEEYRRDRMLRGAVERHLEIIGEAANRVSAEFREAHPEIPWRSIIGQRNVLIHAYGEIRQELIWKTATVHVPELIAHLEPLVPPAPEAKE